MATRTATLIARLIDDVSGPAAGMAKAMHKAADEAKALTKLQGAGGGGKLAADLRKLGASARDIDTVTGALKKFTASQGAIGKSTDWTKAQVQAVRTWEHSVVANMRSVKAAQDAVAASARALGQSQLEAAVKAGRAQRTQAQQAAKAAAVAREEHISRRRDAVVATAGLVGGYKAKQFGVNAIELASEVDRATRYQRVVSEVTEAKQKSLLRPQAKQIGLDTEFTTKDIIEAQTATMASLPIENVDTKAEVGAAIIEQVKNYAQIMKAGMTTSAEGLRSFLANTNKDISTQAKAVQEATRGTNLLVKMAKLGGMDDNDVQAFLRRGFSTGTQAGLSDTTLGAMGVVGRRAGIGGDELGTFTRAVASKLIAPTQKGREALIAADIDIDRFTKMPGGLSPETFEKFQKNRFGKGLSEDQKSRLDGLMGGEDGQVADREKFVTEASAIVAESFDKTKKGKTKAQDAQKIAKMVGDFYKLSVESMDTEGLLKAILENPKMTTALRNAFFTDKHGGKAGVIADKNTEFLKAKDDLEKVTTDPGFSARKAAEITEGLYGSLNQLKGSVEVLTLSFGEANASLAKTSFDKIAAALDGISSLSDKSKQAATAVGAFSAAFLAVKGVQGFLGGFGLVASATALDGSAAALTAAAVKLGASGGLPDVPGGPAKSSKGSKIKNGLGALGFGGTNLPTLGAVAVGGALYVLSDEDKGLTHGGRPGFGMNPGDELPGIPGSNAAPSWSSKRRGSLPPGTAGMPQAAPPRLPGLDGRQTKVDPQVETGALERLHARADEARESLEKAGSTKVAPSVDTALVDGLIEKLMKAIGLLSQIDSKAAGATASVGRLATAASNAGGAVARTGAVAAARSGALTDRGMG